MKNKMERLAGFKTIYGLALLLTPLMLIIISCDSAPDDIKAERYQADLKSVNSEITGFSPEGAAKVYIEGDSVTITVTMSNVPPGIMHLQHIHGFLDDKTAVCPTMAQDTTGDSIIDLIETEQVAGKTLIPFHDNPATMKIAAANYPTADSLGTYSYSKIMLLSELKAGLKEQFGIEKPDWEKRVIFIHGVDTSMALPTTVQSLPDVPAQVTIPIACGKFTAVLEEAY